MSLRDPITLFCVSFYKMMLLFGLFCIVFRAISLNCSETIILTPKDFSKIKIKFDFAQNDEMPKFGQPFESARKEFYTNKQFDQELVRFVVNDKLESLRTYLQMKNGQNSTVMSSTSNDVILLDPFTIPVNILKNRFNVSVDTLRISIVTPFTISDIATNIKSKKVSALLRFPNIQISLYYKVSGLIAEQDSQLTKSYLDKGKVTYSLNGWRTTFFGKVVDIVNKTRLEMAGFGMRSHYDFFESHLESFVYGQDKTELIDICRYISEDIMKKAINALDDRLETTMLDKLGVKEMASWANFKNTEQIEKEEDGQLLMMESKIHENSKRRRKRQVPCEVGEELDEYVDSLFRFLRRLVRVMEPFNLPNATIELEEYNLQIFLHSGGASRAYTFERRRPAWVLCQNDTISLGLTVGIDDLRVNYKYRVIQDWRLLFDGDLEAQVRRPKAQLQITQLSPPENEDEEAEESDEEEQQVQQRVDRLKVWKPGQIVVLIRGLGNLSSALSMIINQMLSDTSTLDPVINMIETDGVVAINEMLKNVSIPIFSII